jgi:phosphatidyl-myo-inositol dimannoside synthase
VRILYLTPGCFDKGGISRYSRYQIIALRALCGSDNVRVMSLLGPDANGFEQPFPVTWHGTGRGIGGAIEQNQKNSRVSFRDRAMFSTRTMALAAMWRPDIIHSAHVNFGPLLTAARRAAGGQSVLNVYGLEIWSGLSNARRKHMLRTGRIIADCHYTARYVTAEKLHLDAPTVIWDPVDLQRFTPGPTDPAIVSRYGLPDPATHLVVMSLGRLAKAAAHKGFDRLIKVIAALAARFPQLRPRLKLVIAGRGDDRPRLEKLAAECGIQDCVHFTGSVDEADLAAVYRCAHVFSLVSDRGPGRGEGIPLTPLEAMACGIPIIVGDEDGSQEAVIEGRNGFVVSPRQPDQHVAALERLLNDPACHLRASRAARAVAVERFGADRFLVEHESFLGSLMRDRV